jgi:hypothetical protein
MGGHERGSSIVFSHGGPPKMVPKRGSPKGGTQTGFHKVGPQWGSTNGGPSKSSHIFGPPIVVSQSGSQKVVTKWWSPRGCPKRGFHQVGSQIGVRYRWYPCVVPQGVAPSRFTQRSFLKGDRKWVPLKGSPPSEVYQRGIPKVVTKGGFRQARSTNCDYQRRVFSMGGPRRGVPQGDFLEVWCAKGVPKLGVTQGGSHKGCSRRGVPQGGSLKGGPPRRAPAMFGQGR